MKTREMIWASDDDMGYLNDSHCSCCGRYMSTIGAWVHVVDGGDQILHPDDEDEYEDDGSDMGFFPVGAGCASKVLAGWTHTKPL